MKKPNPFAGKESKREEKSEKRMPLAAYKKGEAKEAKMFGKKVGAKAKR